MFLEIGQLVPGDFGNFRKVSVLSRCFRIWSAGSGRFRKFSEGFRVFTLFFKLVSWFRKIPEKFGRFPCYPVVCPSWSAVFRLLKVDFNVIPLFSSWSTVFRLISMSPHCFSSWSTVFGRVSRYPVVFPCWSTVSGCLFVCVPIVIATSGNARVRVGKRRVNPLAHRTFYASMQPKHYRDSTCLGTCRNLGQSSGNRRATRRHVPLVQGSWLSQARQDQEVGCACKPPTVPPCAQLVRRSTSRSRALGGAPGANERWPSSPTTLLKITCEAQLQARSWTR